MAPLVVENVSKSFRQGAGRVQALAGISLDVARGQFLAVMGASGSGKSTLLHLMAGLTRCDSGRVLIDGTDLSRLNDRELTRFRRRHVGLVFQSFNLIPTLTAEENIGLPLMLERRLDADDRRKVEETIDRLGLRSRRSHRPDALSGGEQQRVAIGRALVTDPAVVLADEPTGNLDSANSRAVCELLRDLSVIHGKTIVMVTHEPSVAAYAQEVAVIRDGRLLARFDVRDRDGEQLAARYQECLR
ncbi:MAG: ABC transporter ATP-binding protein [Phycisphaerae bacterium]|nr:ABC transporter ATP-binding protein [Phycisphaerae bacterium]MDW8261458.1 ABC transporter ATP-binding protein [Phycisphaerales bacterium]